MKKIYYIIGTLAIGLGGYFLYEKIKNGNVSFNFKNEAVAENELGSHLEPPIEIPSLATTPLV